MRRFSSAKKLRGFSAWQGQRAVLSEGRSQHPGGPCNPKLISIRIGRRSAASLPAAKKLRGFISDALRIQDAFRSNRFLAAAACVPWRLSSSKNPTSNAQAAKIEMRGGREKVPIVRVDLFEALLSSARQMKRIGRAQENAALELMDAIG